MLSTRQVHYRAGRKEILQGIDAFFETGLFHVIVGPNGSGKSTFLKVFSGEIKPQAGEIFYNEKNVFALDKTRLAQMRSVMSQQPELYFPLTVEEIVMMGRYPYFKYKPGRQDIRICTDAMKKMEVEELAGRDYLTLSGGEKQRVQFARVLAQVGDVENENKYLFLDEAVSHLDLKHQHQLLKLAKELCSHRVTVIAILHDLNLALHYADRILFMKEGKIAFDINDSSKMTPGMIREVFDVDAKIVALEPGQKPFVIF
jgi:iron complex transport system ATP-binding protein